MLIKAHSKFINIVEYVSKVICDIIKVPKNE